MPGSGKIMDNSDRKGYEKKQVWPQLRFLARIWLEGLQRTVKSEQSLFWPKSKLVISWVKVKDITTWATFLSGNMIMEYKTEYINIYVILKSDSLSLPMT